MKRSQPAGLRCGIGQEPRQTLLGADTEVRFTLTWLGFRILPGQVRVKRTSVVRAQKRLTRLLADTARNPAGWDRFMASVRSTFAPLGAWRHVAPSRDNLARAWAPVRAKLAISIYDPLAIARGTELSRSGQCAMQELDRIQGKKGKGSREITGRSAGLGRWCGSRAHPCCGMPRERWRDRYCASPHRG